MKTPALLSLSLIIAASLLSACSSEPEWLAVYAECKDTVTTEVEKMKAGADDNEQAAAMRDAMSNMAMTMSMAACEMIRGTCEQDPAGDACQAIIDSRNKDH